MHESSTREREKAWEALYNEEGGLRQGGGFSQRKGHRKFREGIKA